MCGIRIHKFKHCSCTYTYGDIRPGDEYAQGPYAPEHMNETWSGLNARIDGGDYFGCDLDAWDFVPRKPNQYPHHPYMFLCNNKDEVKTEAPKENCPLCGPVKDDELIKRLTNKSGMQDRHWNPHRIGDFSW